VNKAPLSKDLSAFLAKPYLSCSEKYQVAKNPFKRAAETITAKKERKKWDLSGR